MVAVIIALVASMTLIITTALANARLTRSRDEWRTLALNAQRARNWTDCSVESCKWSVPNSDVKCMDHASR
jgi:hypothetical protein